MSDKTHKTRGQLEAEVSRAIVSFEKEYMGRGPREVKTYIIDDMVCVRLNETLTKAEKEMVATDGGVELIKKVRRSMLENSTPYLFDVLKRIIGMNVSHLHSDLSTKSGEHVIIFTMESKIKSTRSQSLTQ